MAVPLAKALKSQLPKDIDALISDYDGYYLTQNQARRIYKQILKEADLEYIRIHGLRHSYATIMLTKGATPVFVKNQLGHSSISITVDLYGDHWLDDENNQADLIEMQPMQPDVAKTETFKGANSQLFEIASNN
jgi:integrase